MFMNGNLECTVFARELSNMGLQSMSDGGFFQSIF